MELQRAHPNDRHTKLCHRAAHKTWPHEYQRTPHASSLPASPLRQRTMDPGPTSKHPSNTRREEDTGVLERTKKPRRYKVLFHNDDFTPMEFVVQVLEQIFHRSAAEATRIMLTVHTSGHGLAGVYSHEVAESKTTRTQAIAQEAGYPLLVTTEPE